MAGNHRATISPRALGSTSAYRVAFPCQNAQILNLGDVHSLVALNFLTAISRRAIDRIGSSPAPAPTRAGLVQVPKGLKDFRAGLEAHRKLHARLIEFVRTTKDDLRGHIVERQSCDAYQWALHISTHEQRHILQIREIKSDARFPKKYGDQRGTRPNKNLTRRGALLVCNRLHQ